MTRRRKAMAPNQETHMHMGGPLHMVRGEGCHLYNDRDEAFLDCVNNVAHVGHCHPKVQVVQFWHQSGSVPAPESSAWRAARCVQSYAACCACSPDPTCCTPSSLLFLLLRLKAWCACVGGGSHCQAAGDAEHQCALPASRRGGLCRGDCQAAASRALRAPLAYAPVSSQYCELCF